MNTTAFPLLAGLLLLAGLPRASSADDAAKESGQKFWGALGTADVAALADYYPAQVTLLAGSELLKPEWGLNPQGDRSQSQTVKRDDLLAAYKKLVEKVGADKWQAIFGKIGNDKLSFQEVAQDNDLVKGARRGDRLMNVSLGNDTLLFVLRRKDNGDWKVVMEQTDY